MNTPLRLASASLLFALAACGNKGPLVRPSAPAPEDATPAPASPPSTDPTNALPSQDTTPPADTGTPVPPAPNADDGAGNG